MANVQELVKVIRDFISSKSINVFYILVSNEVGLTMVNSNYCFTSTHIFAIRNKLILYSHKVTHGLLWPKWTPICFFGLQSKYYSIMHC